MKNKVVIIVFSVIVAALIIYSGLSITVLNKNNATGAKVVKPVSPDSKNEEDNNSDSVSENATMTSFIPLKPTETLMNTLTLDFDGDTFDDQIVAVFKAGSPYLFLIVGLYNSETNNYDRVAEISTEISRIKTFSCNSLDMTGDHRNALIYQGIKSNGDSVMRIYLCRKRRDNVEIQNIGDFTSDGTIFILQTERTEAYALSQATGESFSVWVYSSDKSDDNKNSTNINQIQTEYKWSKSEQKYILANQIKVTGSKLAAKELARIQNGTVETFAQFLNGLWYKTTNTGTTPLYIYFNYNDKEIIFLSDDTEGVYSWEDSNLRRSGIYLTVVNTVISSMKRRFDIMLSGVNEVYIHVHDDVGMVIKESNQWDGTYKKMSFQSSFGDVKTKSLSEQYEKNLTNEKHTWKDDSGREYKFSQCTYSITEDDIKRYGLCIFETIGNFAVIQFRDNSYDSMMQQFYTLRYQTHEEVVPAKNRRSKPTIKTVQEEDTIIMNPVKVSPVTCYPTDGKTIILHRSM